MHSIFKAVMVAAVFVSAFEALTWMDMNGNNAHDNHHILQVEIDCAQTWQ